MLDIKNLVVSIKDENKDIIKDFNLKIKNGEIHAIMGPNGTGKSSLAKTIMGHYKFEIKDGSVFFDNQIINDLSVDERARLGIFLAMQDPTVIEGVTNNEFLKTAEEEITGKHINYYDFIKNVNNAISDLDFSKDMVHRHLNEGFSGGEKKKNEILQLKILKPKFIIFDEIDSGLDIDSLKVVCQNINEYKKENPNISILIITHYPRILELIKPDFVHIMSNGKIVATGDINLAYKTEIEGYHE